MELTPLRELLPQYPEGAPETLSELVTTDTGDWEQFDAEQRQILTELRRQTIDAIHAFERDPILCPDDLTRHLAARRIPMLAKRWMVMCLDARGDRIAVHRSRGGGMRWLQEPYSTLPTPEQLQDKLRLPQGGKYLLIWGGGPDILSDQQTVDALERLVRNLPVTDVTCWWLRSGQAPALLSVRGGIGDQNGTPVEFPDPKPETLFQAFRERS